MKNDKTHPLAAIENAAQIVGRNDSKPLLAGCGSPVQAGCETSPIQAGCETSPIQAGCAPRVQVGSPLLAGCDDGVLIAKSK